MKTCWIRTDASKQIGTGHVFRCLSIAEQIRHHVRSVFVCRALDGHLIELIENQGYEVVCLPQKLGYYSQRARLLEGFENKPLKHAVWLCASQAEDALATAEVLLPRQFVAEDVLLVDHFALDADWETYIQKTLGLSVLVLDGQADRTHSAQMLIDPTACADANKWQGLVSPTTRIFQGVAYVPLHPHFFELQRHVHVRQSFKTLLIAFGGVDAQDFTGKAVQALLNKPIKNLRVEVVVGKNYPHLETLLATCKQHDFLTCHVQTSNMAELMLQADLAIGAGGTMAWERCFLGLPTLVATIADNQRKQVQCLAAHQVAIDLGEQIEHFAEQLATHFQTLQQHPEYLARMSQACLAFVKDLNDQRWINLFEKV